MRAFLSIFLLGLLFGMGCQSTREYLAGFHGMHRSELLGRLGPADQIIPDERGGEIWIYQEKVVSITPGTEEVVYQEKDKQKKVTERRVVTPPKETVRIHVKSFYINSEGIVYNTAFGTRAISR